MFQVLDSGAAAAAAESGPRLPEVFPGGEGRPCGAGGRGRQPAGGGGRFGSSVLQVVGGRRPTLPQTFFVEDVVSDMLAFTS